MRMSMGDKFCIKWNNFESHVRSAFRSVRKGESFVDVTLAFDDGELQAHKVILSAGSSFFHDVLHRISHEHPFLYLKGARKADLISILDFMYLGEVNVAQEDLTSFLSLAEDLQVKGLTHANNLSAHKPGSPFISSHSQKDLREHGSLNPAALKRPRIDQANRLSNSQYLQDLSQQHNHINQNENPDNLLNINVEEPSDGLDHSDLIDNGFNEGQSGVETVNENGLQVMNMSAAEGNEEMEALVQSYLERGVDELTGRLHWLCRQCGKSHQNYGNLRDHIEANHIEGPRLVCQLCLKSFKSTASLRMHKRRYHK